MKAERMVQACSTNSRHEKLITGQYREAHINPHTRNFVSEYII
jgi:hypothetical protein